jgi:hypothetical protein
LTPFFLLESGNRSTTSTYLLTRDLK